MSKLPEEIRTKIQNVRMGRSTWLDLGHAGLQEIPNEVFDLSELQQLHLWRNRIRIVPERIRELKKLKRLDLWWNPIETVPDVPGLSLDWDSYLRCRQNLSPMYVLGLNIRTGRSQDEPIPISDADEILPVLVGLPALRELRIGLDALTVRRPLRLPEPEAAIQQVIDRIGELSALKRLTLWGVSLAELPVGIRKLQGLEYLHAICERIEEIPTWISDLRELETLHLSDNSLGNLPKSLAFPPKLTRISIAENNFQTIPKILFQITTLGYLDISRHKSDESEPGITEIPSDILRLPLLRAVDVRGQPIQTPPPEVVKQGIDAIKNYWRQQQEAGVDYLCEAKLLIVGEPGAGKTSLARKIEDSAYKLKPREASTEGIEVIRWKSPAAIRVKQSDGERLLQSNFAVNLWDFGGQEIYHATHQFFLTRRSLYLLVADDRKEDTDFNWWLEVVELLSDGSPLLIVQNEKQGRRRDINLPSLRARFPNLKEAYRINLATNSGLEDLTKAIRQELERLPHIGTPLPATWKRVREALERDERNHIDVNEFFEICEAEGFKRDEDKLQLSGYMHDLGICLHFQDDPILKHRVILKPKWATDAVYRVLDDRDVINNRGRFSREDLAHIWEEDTYAAMRDELLRLMMRFQLCYPLPERDAYIAPQLLSSDQPEYAWNSGANLVLRYAYEFMPKGMLTRFIVALNHLIADQRLVWKTGVVLEREDTKAVVLEDYPGRAILVRIAGADTRGLLVILDDQLERIHRFFPLLRYDKHLPCNCLVCRASTEPYSFSLKELRDFARTGDHIQCRISRKLVDAAALVRDVMPSALRADIVLEAGTTRPVEIAPPEPESVKEVFVSYAWKSEESVSIIDKLEQAFKDRDIQLIRDKSEMKYKDPIRSFMQRLGRGKCVVVVLSKAYLTSESCMFELTELASRGDLRDRVFPIVLADAEIYKPKARLQYVKHWEREKAELDAAMKEVGSENLQGIRETIDLYAKIRTTTAGIVDILGDMNALTPEQHRGSKFDALFRALESRLSD